jgi:pimeloyl-ACP methyl ester carboxylesterase
LRNHAGKTEINGKKINYFICNEEYLTEEKPVLVFLHEGLGSIRQWKDFPASLSEKTELAVLLYDRYGYGDSDSLTEKRNTDYIKTEASLYLPELLKNLNIKNNIILFGHSDGATIALYFASIFPQITLGIISESAHTFIEDVSINGVSAARDSFIFGDFLRQKLEKYHRDNAVPMFFGWADLWSNPAAKKWSMLKELKNVKSPVLVIQGDTDEYGSKMQVDEIKKRVNADCEILYLKDCGHIPHFQAKDPVLQKSTDFINNLLL